jgi:hypothetical protein
LIRRADVLKAFVQPVEADPNEENPASYQRGTWSSGRSEMLLGG